MSGTPLFPFICLPLSPSLDAWHCFLVGRFTFLPLSPFIWLLLSPSLEVCHGSPGGRIHLSPLVPLHLSPISVGGRISPVVSQPGCLARLSGWTDSFVSRCLPAWMCGTHAPRFPSLPAVLSFWRGLVCLRLWPGFGHSLSCGCWGQGPPLSALHLDFDFAWARGGSSSLSIVGYTLSVRSVPRYQLRSQADDSGALRCAASATRRLCYPPGETNVNHAGVKSSIDSSRMFNEPYAEIRSGALGTWGGPGSPGGRVHLSPSPSICLTDSLVFLCLPLFGPGCLPAWTPVTALWSGGVHLSPFVSLHLSPVVSQPGCLARLSGWTGSFVTLCLPSFVSRCLPAWMPGTALWVDGFICLPLSPFICLARLSGLCFPSFVSRCLPAWMSGTALQADRFTCLPLSPFICPRCLPAWMPGTALWVDSFTCLPLSPFIWLPLSPSLDVTALQADGFTCLPWFPFICLPSLWVDGLICLPFQPGCLSGWTDSFVSLCLPLFVSLCLPAWMPLWVDGFICLPLSPSLDVWHSRSAVSFTSRGSVLLAGSGLPSASALASVIPCLVDVGDRVLCLPFIWTSILLGLVVGRLPCLSLATPCLFVQCLVISCGLSLSLLAFGVPS